MSAEIGRVLGGRYRLVAPIGLGASAQVFLADDVRLRRRVAVKMLHDALAGDAEFLRRFRAEAQAAAALSHPNVMAVYDWGDEEIAFIVTEYLAGGSLRALLDRGELLSPSQALTIGLEAARALDYAHRRGFVHRDIKPANLLFGEEQRLRIADFGLARALAEAAWTEPQGAMLGTARYASPEQAKGEKLSGKADVYALALVLVEAVTGTVPFTADTTLGTLMARVDRPLEVPDALASLQGILTRAGHPDPEERIDARTLAAGLLRAAKGLPRPAPLPLAGALSEVGGPTRDADPTLHAPIVEKVVEPTVSPELTEDDLDLDPPDWVNNATPALVATADPAAPGEIGIEPEPAAERIVIAPLPVLDGADADPLDPVDDQAIDGEAMVEADAPDVDHADAPDPDDAVDATDPGPVEAPEADAEADPGDDDETGDPLIPVAADADEDPSDGVDHDGADDHDYAGDPDPEPEPDRAATAVVAAPTMVAAGADRAADPDRLTRTADQPAVVIDPDDHGDDDQDDPAGAGRGRRRWPLVLAVLILLAAGAGLLAAVTYDPPRHDAGPPVVLPVPGVEALTQTQATQVLASSGWRVETTAVRRNDTRKGQVLGVTPAVGTRLPKGRTITLVVSSGQPIVDLPQGLVGEPLDTVVAAFAKVGLVAEESGREYHEEIAKGAVIKYDDGTPGQLERGSKVGLVVSNGPRPRVVPDGLAGLTEAKARQLITAEGLKVAVNRQNSDTVAQGTVVAQLPAGGTQLSRGSTVTIQVSKGPKTVAVPDVSWTTTPAQAASVLRSKGLVPGKVTGPAEGTPKRTSPAAGTQVREGSKVDIVVG